MVHHFVNSRLKSNYLEILNGDDIQGGNEHEIVVTAIHIKGIP